MSCFALSNRCIGCLSGGCIFGEEESGAQVCAPNLGDFVGANWSALLSKGEEANCPPPFACPEQNHPVFLYVSAGLSIAAATVGLIVGGVRFYKWIQAAYNRRFQGRNRPGSWNPRFGRYVALLDDTDDDDEELFSGVMTTPPREQLTSPSPPPRIIPLPPPPAQPAAILPLPQPPIIVPPPPPPPLIVLAAPPLILPPLPQSDTDDEEEYLTPPPPRRSGRTRRLPNRLI